MPFFTQIRGHIRQAERKTISISKFSKANSTLLDKLLPPSKLGADPPAGPTPLPAPNLSPVLLPTHRPHPHSSSHPQRSSTASVSSSPTRFPSQTPQQGAVQPLLEHLQPRMLHAAQAAGSSWKARIFLTLSHSSLILSNFSESFTVSPRTFGKAGRLAFPLAGYSPLCITKLCGWHKLHHSGTLRVTPRPNHPSWAAAASGRLTLCPPQPALTTMGAHWQGSAAQLLSARMCLPGVY